ncbi:MAG: dipeptide ABC transporter ATP-binding protein [Alphaproteobacteria bacterium]|nr:dipeptide ABC transporter ATP-binding protein [Alphaproteobacteria bacterium]
MKAPVLDIQDLNVSLGATRVLRGVSLQAHAGEITAIVGASGSGKTMTLRAVMHLLPRAARTSGLIAVEGETISTHSEDQMNALRGARIGMVFQEPLSALNPVQRIGAQIAETVRLHRKTARAEAQALALQALAAMGLAPDFARRFPHELSGGQRQRACIAIATALHPPLLLADEPTTALDVTTQAHILDLFRTLARDSGAAVVLVSHDLATVEKHADRIIVMEDGAVREAGPTAQLFAQPKEAYTRALIAASHPQPKPAARSPGETLLSVRDLSVTHTSRSLRNRREIAALKRVAFDVRRGERVAVLGESGAGKSTLARALLGFEHLDSGEVRIDGASLYGARPAEARALRRRIQIVFQDPYASFNPRQRIEDALSAPLSLIDPRMPREDRRARAAAMLQRVGLKEDALDRHPHAFSGGQRQRIAIARALMTEPDIVVFDEATSSLDVLVREQILALLHDIAAERTLASLFITHDLVLAPAVADRVILMKAGEIIEDAPIADFFANPQHPYAKALLAAAPRPALA